MQRGYGRAEIEEMGFQTKEYDFPEAAGSFIGMLVMKKWTNKAGLICYENPFKGTVR